MPQLEDHGGGQVGLLLKEWRRLVIRDGIMYSLTRDHQRGVVEQLVLPEKLPESVKMALHDDSGHLGVERTVQMISPTTDVPGDKGLV